MPKDKRGREKRSKRVSNWKGNRNSLRDAYAAYIKQKIIGYRIYGFPGAQLSKAQRKYGKDKSWIQGRIGEKLFMSILAREGILDQCVSFWSLKRDKNRDIDSVLLFDNEIVLVDVKSMQGEKSEEETRRQLKGKVKSMKNAKKQLQKRLGKKSANIPINCYIVFVPTPETDLRKIKYDHDSVHVTWYKKFCKEMNQTQRHPKKVNKAIERRLAAMAQKPARSYGSQGDAEWDNERWQASYGYLLKAWGALSDSPNADSARTSMHQQG